MHGHLAAPATTPVGAWLAEQRHLASRNTLEAARVEALTALAADWRLPHGADWHRKYHLLRAHLAGGADPATLTRDTQLAGVKIGSWLHRQLATWPALAPGQQQLMTALGLTPETNPLVPARRARRAPSPRPSSSWSSTCTARAAPPPPARRSASTATPSRSAPGSPRPAPSTAPASSPTTMYA
ncbi:helicase associated domain-containing protein [Streptomyces sp. NPDC042638]|uniref:helicase associated domain-containing protein n=1 Tax=Streptomyces sp. NPDC042638 TaxID=3154333 RepID=UPI0033C999B1